MHDHIQAKHLFSSPLLRLPACLSISTLHIPHITIFFFWFEFLFQLPSYRWGDEKRKKKEPFYPLSYQPQTQPREREREREREKDKYTNQQMTKKKTAAASVTVY